MTANASHIQEIASITTHLFNDSNAKKLNQSEGEENR
jgi:hypothetical protein